jgi:lantibiotic modifying enzyme
MGGASLYDAGEHRQLAGDEWSDRRALEAIDRITSDAIAAYRGPDSVWPNAAEDLEGEADEPFRNVYFGAAGVAWALDYLARRDVAPVFGEAGALARRLHHDFLHAPELTSYESPPAPSLFFGESGILLAAEAILGDGSQAASLESAINRNVEHPSLELCWGSPGTMTAALALWRSSGEERWRNVWSASADHLLSEWRELVWTQDLYGTTRQYVGAGHGFAGNAFVLLSGRDLLGERADTVVERVRDVLIRLARQEGSLAQWFPLMDTVTGRHPIQWCHGSPGIITSLVDLPHEDETDRLLHAGGELTWEAGPLTKGPGLCHGTAGNAYAFLALFARSNDEVWLARARAFAMDAAADVERRRVERSRGRYSLYTGDVGVAMLLQACRTGDHRFPFLDGALLQPRRSGLTLVA